MCLGIPQKVFNPCIRINTSLHISNLCLSLTGFEMIAWNTNLENYPPFYWPINIKSLADDLLHWFPGREMRANIDAISFANSKLDLIHVLNSGSITIAYLWSSPCSIGTAPSISCLYGIASETDKVKSGCPEFPLLHYSPRNCPLQVNVYHPPSLFMFCMHWYYLW